MAHGLCVVQGRLPLAVGELSLRRSASGTSSDAEGAGSARVPCEVAGRKLRGVRRGYGSAAREDVCCLVVPARYVRGSGSALYAVAAYVDARALALRRRL